MRDLKIPGCILDSIKSIINGTHEDKVTEKIVREFDWFMRSRIQLDELDVISSPIEKLFYLYALDYQSAMRYRHGNTIRLYILPQWKITDGERKYIVDFYFDCESINGELHLVVECDGHDFHEKTKEQAKKDKSRDRDLLKLGYQVIRFTGSEIWNNPDKCAKETFEIIEEKLCID